MEGNRMGQSDSDSVSDANHSESGREFRDIAKQTTKKLEDFDAFNGDSMSLSSCTNSGQTLVTSLLAGSPLDLSKVSPKDASITTSTTRTGVRAEQQVIPHASRSPKSPSDSPSSPSCGTSSSTSKIVRRVEQRRQARGLPTDGLCSSLLPRPGSSGNRKYRCRVHGQIEDLEDAVLEQEAGHKKHEQQIRDLHRENNERKRELKAIEQRRQQKTQQRQQVASLTNPQNAAIPRGLGCKCPDCGGLYSSSLSYVLYKHRGNSACRRHQRFGFRSGNLRGGGRGPGANFRLGQT